MGSTRQVPLITREVGGLSRDLVRILTPLRHAVNEYEGNSDRRMVRKSELDALQDKVNALTTTVAEQIGTPVVVRQGIAPETADAAGASTLEPPVFGFLQSLDTAGAQIGREDTDHDTDGADSSTWVTVYTFALGTTGTIAVRVNAYDVLVGSSFNNHGQVRLLANGVEVGAPVDLTTTVSDEQSWTDIDVNSVLDAFEIQLKASNQDTGDADAYISWAEVRALVSHVAWT